LVTNTATIAWYKRYTVTLWKEEGDLFNSRWTAFQTCHHKWQTSIYVAPNWRCVRASCSASKVSNKHLVPEPQCQACSWGSSRNGWFWNDESGLQPTLFKQEVRDIRLRIISVGTKLCSCWKMSVSSCWTQLHWDMCMYRLSEYNTGGSYGWDGRGRWWNCFRHTRTIQYEQSFLGDIGSTYTKEIKFLMTSLCFERV